MIRRIAVFLSFLLLAGGALADDDWSGGTTRIGGKVEVSEPTPGALNAMGGQVLVEAPVQGQLRAAAGQIEVSAPIEGSAFLAGGKIAVSGPIQGDLRAAGGQIFIDGPVAGDASIAGGSLVLGPNARIEGQLKFRGGELNRGWMWSVGLVVLAALLAGVLPGPSQRLAQELLERPGMTTLLGFLALTAIPVAAVMLMITIIGIPIALLGLVLYAALLMIGYVWLAVVLGGLLLDRFKAETAAVIAWRVGAAALAMIILAIAVRVPFVGGFVMLAALVVGVGMIVGVVMRKVRPPQALT
jgi:hypothetical protein